MSAHVRRSPVPPEAFDFAGAPRRLNLGCGWDYREGYVNVDLHAVHGPDLVADVRRLAFLPPLEYEEIVAQDVLEHMPRTQTVRILEHWNRLLRPGGVLRLRLPNAVALLELLKRKDYRDPLKQEEVIHFLFGTQAYTGDFHYTSFTDVLIRDYLQRAGFRVTRLEPFDYWLYDVQAVKARHIDGGPVIDPREISEIREDVEFVHTCYREILQREPDPGGLETYLQALRSGMPREQVIRLFLDSDEYRSRFSSDTSAGRPQSRER